MVRPGLIKKNIKSDGSGARERFGRAGERVGPPVHDVIPAYLGPGRSVHHTHTHTCWTGYPRFSATQVAGGAPCYQ